MADPWSGHGEPGHNALGHDAPGHDAPGQDEAGHDEAGWPVGRPAGRDATRWHVDDLRPQDHEAWARLHRGYLDFYESSRPEEVSSVVWSWLQDPGHELEALVVRPAPAAEPVGLAHYRPFARPLHGSTACFLDDLFVAPQARGTGAVDALLAALQQRCRERGWSHVRWVTRASNSTAQSTYDRLAVRTDLVTYDLDAAPAPATP